MGTYFGPCSLFTKTSGIIHRGKIRVQSNPLKRYGNIKASIAASNAQSRYLSIITSENLTNLAHAHSTYVH